MSHPQGANESIEQFGYKQELHRALSFRDLLTYGLIFMVPIAPFGIFGGVFNGSGGMVALAYAIGMVGMMLTASSYAQMSRAFPMAGSVYTYAGRGINPSIGFLAGWVIFLDYVLVPTLLYIVAAIAMNSFVASIPVWGWLLVFIITNTIVNLRGIELTAKFNKYFLIAELAVLALFIVIGVIAIASGKGNGFSFDAFYNSKTFSISLVLGAVSIAVLSFLGFDGISMLAEESKEKADQIGKSMVAALLLAGSLFIVQTWIAAMLVPGTDKLLTEGDPSGTAFYAAAEVAGGVWLNKLTALATAIAWGFANALVAQAATSRLLFAMARDKQLPSFLAKIHPKSGGPVNATYVTSGISVVLGLYFVTQKEDFGLTLTSTLVNFGALTAFIVLHLSVIIHHKIRNKSGDNWRHLVVPILGIILLSWVVVKANVAAQRTGIVWAALGILILVVQTARGKKPKLSGMEN
ncbi:MAG: APC family permease [Candidatus Planktophila sp.]